MHNLQELKRHVQNGNIQIAKLDSNNKPVKVQMNDFEEKTKNLNKQQKLYKLVQTLSWEDKYEWCNTRRLKGNALYKNGQTDQALETYLECLIGLERDNADSSKNEAMKVQLQIPILMNMATCFYAKKQYQKGIQLCDQLLQSDIKYSKHPQALFKKANFLYELGRFDKAKQTVLLLNKVIEQGQNQSKIKAIDVKSLIVKILKKTKEQVQIYKKFFSQDQDNLSTQSSEDQKDVPIIQYEQNYIKSALNFFKLSLNKCCRIPGFGSANGRENVQNEQKIPLFYSKSL